MAIIPDLIQLIREKVPDINVMQLCNVLRSNEEELQEVAIKFEDIVDKQGLLLPFGIQLSNNTFNEFLEAVNKHYHSLSIKYGYSNELMPVVFELLAQNSPPGIMDIFKPMLEYFTETVLPEINLYKESSVINCPYSVKTNDDQCLIVEKKFDDNFIFGQCITDLSAYE